MGGEYLKNDPAIDKWATMRENTVKHFKWTPRTTRKAVMWGVLVPFAIYEYAVIEAKSLAKLKGKPEPKFPSVFS